MNQKQFNEAAKQILKKQPSEKVDNFLGLFSYRIATGLGRYENKIRYRKTDDWVIKMSKSVKGDLKRIARDPLYSFAQIELQNAIKIIELTLERNEIMKPGGRQRGLPNGDILMLVILKDAFVQCFPDLAHSFNHDTILYQLGERLLDKSLPNSTGKLVDERSQYKGTRFLLHKSTEN